MSVLDPGGVQIDASRNVHENGLKLVRRLVEVVYGFVSCARSGISRELVRMRWECVYDVMISQMVSLRMYAAVVRAIVTKS